MKVGLIFKHKLKKDDPGADQAFFGGGTKYYEQVRNSSKVSVSVLFACTASGDMLPPMTVYKSTTGAVYTTWCEGGPPGAVYAATKSGWFNMNMFNSWFEQIMLPYIRSLPREEKKVIIGDNLAAHLSPFVIRICEQYNVRFLFLPENSTHMLQPLDIAVFRAMKQRWRSLLRC